MFWKHKDVFAADDPVGVVVAGLAQQPGEAA